MTTITEQNIAILSKEERAILASTWSSFHSFKLAKATDMLLYSLLRGKPARNGFTPITSAAKLNNGHAPWAGYKSAINTLFWMRTSPEFYHMLARLLPGTSTERLSAIRDELALRLEQARKEASNA